MTADLLTMPWVPVISGGQREAVGLREIFLRAGEVTEIDGGTPLETGALLRLLVAITLRLTPDFDSRVAVWRAGQFDQTTVREYFDRWKDRFDLFHPERPFFQDAAFATGAGSVASLVPHMASGSNLMLFDHTRDEVAPELSPAEAARALLVQQAYGLCGGQGSTSKAYGKHPYRSSGPAAGGVNVFVLGETLLQTLLLNCVDAQHTVPGVPGQDRPVWEREAAPRPGIDAPTGLLDFLTWSNRCIRLVPEQVNGETVVRTAHLAQCRVLDRAAPVRDPFVPFRPSKAKGIYPLTLSQGRALWRDSTSLFSAGTRERGEGERLRPRVFDAADELLFELELEPALRCLAVGMDSDEAKIKLWRAESMPLPRDLLRDNGDAVRGLIVAVHKAEETGGALHDALRVLARWLLDAPKGNPKKQAIGDMAQGFQGEPAYWHRLDEPFRVMLHGLSERPQEALKEWHAAIYRAAWRAFGEAERLVGTSPRALHARVAAGGLLAARLHPLKPTATTDSPTKREGGDHSNAD